MMAGFELLFIVEMKELDYSLVDGEPDFLGSAVSGRADAFDVLNGEVLAFETIAKPLEGERSRPEGDRDRQDQNGETESEHAFVHGYSNSLPALLEAGR